MPDNERDSELVPRALDGDNEACGLLILRHYRRVFAFCKAQVWCQAAAEDLSQDAFISGLKKLRRLRDHDKFFPWLIAIARKLCSRWRSRRDHRAGPLPPWGPARDCPGFRKVERDDWLRHQLADVGVGADLINRVEGRLRAADLQVCLLEKVEGLPRRLRAVVVLHYLGGLTYAQIADVIGCCPATVGILLRKARERLRERPGPDVTT